MLVTGVTGPVYTVTRGIEGTTAAQHVAGTAVVAVLTGGALDEMRSEIEGETPYRVYNSSGANDWPALPNLINAEASGTGKVILLNAGTYICNSPGYRPPNGTTVIGRGSTLTTIRNLNAPPFGPEGTSGIGANNDLGACFNNVCTQPTPANGGNNGVAVVGSHTVRCYLSVAAPVVGQYIWWGQSIKSQISKIDAVSNVGGFLYELTVRDPVLVATADGVGYCTILNSVPEDITMEGFRCTGSYEGHHQIYNGVRTTWRDIFYDGRTADGALGTSAFSLDDYPIQSTGEYCRADLHNAAGIRNPGSVGAYFESGTHSRYYRSLMSGGHTGFATHGAWNNSFSECWADDCAVGFAVEVFNSITGTGNDYCWLRDCETRCCDIGVLVQDSIGSRITNQIVLNSATQALSQIGSADGTNVAGITVVLGKGISNTSTGTLALSDVILAGVSDVGVASTGGGGLSLRNSKINIIGDHIAINVNGGPVDIQGLAITGAQAGQPTVQVWNATRASLKDCTITGGRVGVQALGCSLYCENLITTCDYGVSAQNTTGFIVLGPGCDLSGSANPWVYDGNRSQIKMVGRGGNALITTTGGNTTLTWPQNYCESLTVGGVLAGSAVLFSLGLPGMTFVVDNITTGAFTTTLKCTGDTGAGVTIAQGKSAMCRVNSVGNMVRVTADI